MELVKDMVINPKCSNCKCYFLPIIKTSGLFFKTCVKCRESSKKHRQGNKDYYNNKRVEHKQENDEYSKIYRENNKDEI